MAFKALTAVFPGAGFLNLMSFQNGGIVPGPIGRPHLAVVHGGEEISGANRKLPRGDMNLTIENNIVVEGEVSDESISKLQDALERGDEEAIRLAKSMFSEGKSLEGESS